MHPRSLVCAGLVVLAISTRAFAQAPNAPSTGIPQGEVLKFSLAQSKIFPGTDRDYWVYVPAQYKPETPTAVMVFQDGGSYIRTGERGWQTPIVLDNLIHKGEIPVMIGIFINPGVMPAQTEQQQARYNRSFEYDALGDRYARFLLEEILPDVAKDYNLSDDPNARGIGGSSSGAICAFTAAWHRPQLFGRVLSHCGSFANIRGGHNYPYLVRTTEPKPLRIFMTSGVNDLDHPVGNWPLANEQMAAALEYAGYDYRFEFGEGGHSLRHGGSLFADSLRWIFR